MRRESRADRWGLSVSWVGSVLVAALAIAGPLAAQQRGTEADQNAGEGQQQQQTPVEMTLERMVDLSLDNSYRIQNLNLSIQRTRHRLSAEEARLKTNVSLQLSVPEFESSADPRWNSTIGRNEIIHETTRRWEGNLRIRQPVILFGYPTNGFLSLNNRVYRYNQIGDDGQNDLRYYNRYFIRYTQPLFQPNGLKNDLEEAQLSLEGSELNFYGDVVDMVDDVSGDYLELFEDAYDRVINENLVSNLQLAVAAATEIAQADPDRTLDLNQAVVELANAEQQLEQSLSDFRIRAADLKTRLNIPETDSLTLNPVIMVNPVPINVADATQFALTATPRMRQLDIQYRRNELNLDQTRGRNSFRLNLNFSYGREALDSQFRNVFGSPTNTYSVDVTASIPLWDGGERRERIASSEINLEQTSLRIEQAETDIVQNVENEVRNVAEFQDRALNMEQNVVLASELSASTLALYNEGTASMFDLLQTFRTEAQTAENLLDAYLGWRNSLLRIQRQTYFDFELGVPVLERYGVTLPGQGT